MAPTQWLTAAVFSLLAGTIFHSASAQSSSPGAISGSVFDAASGAPIADAVVQLSSADGLRPIVSRRQTSSPRGRYIFAELLPQRDYAVTVSYPGYLPGAFGSVAGLHGSRRAIRLAAGQLYSDANVRLWAPASVSGIVRDEAGAPVVGSIVRVVAIAVIGGRERLAMGAPFLTDDRGHFHIGMLQPGEYSVLVPSVLASLYSNTSLANLVAASPTAAETEAGQRRLIGLSNPIVPADGSMSVVIGGYPGPLSGNGVYPPTFAGGGSPRDGRRLLLKNGENVEDLNITLAPVSAVRVSGTVLGPPEARGNLVIRLIREGLEDLGHGSEAATTLTGATGDFVFPRVAPGQYTIEAPACVGQFVIGAPALFYQPTLPMTPGLGRPGTTGMSLSGAPGFGIVDAVWSRRGYWGRVNVTVVAGADTVVQLPLERTIRITGRFASAPSDSTTDRPADQRFLRLEPLDEAATPCMARSQPGPDAAGGEFVIENLLPGRYAVQEESGRWLVRSMMVQGREESHGLSVAAGQDMSDITVNLTRHGATLLGVVRQGGSTVDVAAVVVVFPGRDSDWSTLGLNPLRARTVVTSTTGGFSIPMLPAGDYNVLAMPVESARILHSPGFFTRASAVASRVSLTWGDSKSIDLTPVTVR